MRVGTDTIVKVKYNLEVEDGTTPAELSRTFDAEFLYGRDPVIPVLEKAIWNLEEGENVEVVIPPEQAFGKYNKSLVNEIPCSQISRPDKLKKGEIYQEITATGHEIRFTVKDIKEDTVVADFSHPAAGKKLRLKAEIVSVRAATSLDILRCMNMNRGGG